MVLRECTCIEEADLGLKDPTPTRKLLAKNTRVLEPGKTLQEYKREIVSWAVAVHQGNQSATARSLAKSRNDVAAMLQESASAKSGRLTSDADPCNE
jgi:DNA-binding NtrC family response regulator